MPNLSSALARSGTDAYTKGSLYREDIARIAMSDDMYSLNGKWVLVTGAAGLI